jgi:hypothetical protein
MEETTSSVEECQGGLAARLRHALVVAQNRTVITDRLSALERALRERYGAIPEQLRDAVSRLVERARVALDIPSRTEITALLERIEAIDSKLHDIERSRAARSEAARERRAESAQRQVAAGTPPGDATPDAASDRDGEAGRGQRRGVARKSRSKTVAAHNARKAQGR